MPESVLEINVLKKKSDLKLSFFFVLSLRARTHDNETAQRTVYFF